MKAKITKILGHTFRSRLEAKWALFFHLCGLKFVYEPQLFTTASGLQYLPDFLIETPKSFVFVEIKPKLPPRGSKPWIKIVSFGKMVWSYKRADKCCDNTKDVFYQIACGEPRDYEVYRVCGECSFNSNPLHESPSVKFLFGTSAIKILDAVGKCSTEDIREWIMKEKRESKRNKRMVRMGEPWEMLEAELDCKRMQQQ